MDGRSAAGEGLFSQVLGVWASLQMFHSKLSRNESIAPHGYLFPVSSLLLFVVRRHSSLQGTANDHADTRSQCASVCGTLYSQRRASTSSMSVESVTVASWLSKGCDLRRRNNVFDQAIGPGVGCHTFVQFAWGLTPGFGTFVVPQDTNFLDSPSDTTRLAR